MHPIAAPIPRIAMAHQGPLYHGAARMLQQQGRIEAWFAERFIKYPPLFSTSVDLRNAGYKLAAIDTNIFPAGFNNLSPETGPFSIHAIRAALELACPGAKSLLILPEEHTRNRFYLENLAVLRDRVADAGYEVHLGSLVADSETLRTTALGQSMRIVPIERHGELLSIAGHVPDLVLLNNDLSSGMPALLEGIAQPIVPSVRLGWYRRRKSMHCLSYQKVVSDFSELFGLCAWSLLPHYDVVHSVDFMKKTGMEYLAEVIDAVLGRVREGYRERGITDTPYVVVKTDNGTYGMGVMAVSDPQMVLELSRAQRKKMAASKGSQTITSVLVQEGIYTHETIPPHMTAEPVVYLIHGRVVGGFYRMHPEKGIADNLNAPGMLCKPFALLDASAVDDDRFYPYSVVARLAALAAAQEMDI